MPKVLVLYGTSEGHSRKVAGHLADVLEKSGFETDVRVVSEAPDDLSSYRAAFVLSSVHAGRHSPGIVEYVRDHRAGLSAFPTAFLSIGLFEAVAEDPRAPEGRREAAREEVEAAIAHFLEETGWHPTFVHPVAGAIPYRHVGLLKRGFLYWMSAQIGLPDDFSRDHVLTDWAAVDGYVAELAATLSVPPVAHG